MSVPERIIGPVLPNTFKNEVVEVENDVTSSKSDQLYGPMLPPNFNKTTEKPEDKIIGPTLPKNWGKIEVNSEVNSQDESDDEFEIGPKPSFASDASSTERIEREFEKRAEKMKNKLCGINTDKEVKREEWMTELPTEMAKSFGLGPRTFSRKTPLEAGDRSIWTDTPADKERKERLRIDQKTINAGEIKKTKKISPHQQNVEVDPEPCRESLMEIHKKNLKRKAEADNKPKERRPFDRDADLQANRFDKAKRDSLIKRSRELHSRFGSGQAKFL